MLALFISSMKFLVYRAEIGRQHGEARSQIEALRDRIVAARAERRAGAAMQLRRLAEVAWPAESAANQVC